MLHRTTLAAVLLASLVACSSSSSPASPTPTPSPSPAPSPSPSPAPAPAGPTVSIVPGAAARTATAYSPNPLSVSLGTTVTWVNDDTVAHTSTADSGAWDSGTLQTGGRFSVTFQSAGTVMYFCSIHPGMVGSVIVQ